MTETEQATETHTPEPWRADGQVIFGDVGSKPSDLMGEVHVGVINRAENRVRIVACVNACADLSTERLSELLDFGGLAFVHDVYLRHTQVRTKECKECADQESHERGLVAELTDGLEGWSEPRAATDWDTEYCLACNGSEVRFGEPLHHKEDCPWRKARALLAKTGAH